MSERLATELDLLTAIYPENAKYDSKAQELTYTLPNAKLELRIPDGYLDDTLPEVLGANVGKRDLRSSVKAFISKCDTGEEILDSIVASFTELVEDNSADVEQDMTGRGEVQGDDAKATIIVWLHHLLNTNKRKLALAPQSGDVSGVTKPGYPGVLVYSGAAKAVREHVNELKQQNWQAFQIRLESDEEWTFSHGKGVIEVEAMKDLVLEMGESRKETFLEVMKIK